MAHEMTRREWLIGSLGAAGMLAGRRWPSLRAAEDWLPARLGPDRSKQAPASPVAIQRCESYEPQLVRRKLDEALNLIGGIAKMVSGKTVTVKLNLTGGPGKLAGLPAYRTYHVHPHVVAALCAALDDAGAKRIILAESTYSRKPFEEVYGNAGWDIAAIRSAGGHRVVFEDTRHRGKHPSYSRLKVAWGGYIFPAFDVHPCYDKTDVFISLAKLKDHASAGVTMAVKNLFGIPPSSLYGNDAPNEDSTSNRMAILHHGKRTVPSGVPAEVDHKLPADARWRVPRVTADTLGARPIDLSIIDGIESNRGGEGPWVRGVEPIQPKLLFAGLNPVSTDAIATAAMGYDPQAAHHEFPFQGENHLLLLAAVGAGAIDPRRIEVRGLPLEKAVHPFNPRRLPVKAASAEKPCRAIA